MNATEIVKLISDTLSRAEEQSFADTVEARQAEGWASPVVQAQSEWQGHDNGIVYGEFASAVADLAQYGEVPTGCQDHDDETDPAEHLASALATAGVRGTGEPLVYIGVDGFFTLIRAGATADEVAAATLDCLPDGGDEDAEDA